MPAAYYASPIGSEASRAAYEEWHADNWQAAGLPADADTAYEVDHAGELAALRYDFEPPDGAFPGPEPEPGLTDAQRAALDAEMEAEPLW